MILQDVAGDLNMGDSNTIYSQKVLTLPPKERGFHLITSEIKHTLEVMPAFKTGMVHVFIQHTSASLTISENTCADVRQDLEHHFNRSIPEDNHLYQHTLEGSDDMPAHIKNVTIGSSLTIPIINGELGLGQWQGIYLCEHRNHSSQRTIVITAQGALFQSS